MKSNVVEFAEKRPDLGLVSAEVVAEVLDLSARTVYEMAQRNEIPHYRIGRAVRFRLEEVLQWLEQHRSGPEV